MKTRDLIFPLIVIPAAAAFLMVCILMWLHRGDNKNLVYAKIRIGAFLLSFSFFASCGHPQPTCYEVAPAENTLNLSISGKQSKGDTIKGYIYSPTFPQYSYTIIDSTEHNSVQNGLLSALDSTTNSGSNAFFIYLDTNLRPGKYKLRIYAEKSTTIKHDLLMEENAFQIIP